MDFSTVYWLSQKLNEIILKNVQKLKKKYKYCQENTKYLKIFIIHSKFLLR